MSRAMIQTCAIGLLAIALMPAIGCAPPGASGLAVWAVSDTRELTPDSEPLPENEVYSATGRNIRLNAAINETVAFQLGVRALSSTVGSGPLDVSVSDFSGPSGGLRAAQVVSVSRAQYVLAQQFRPWYPAHTGRSATPRLVADMLIPWNAPRGGGPLTLDGSQCGVIWVDLFVPPTTAPGEYKATIELTDTRAKASAYRGEIMLRVRPVALPSERTFPVLCRVDVRPLLALHLNWPIDTVEETRLLPDVPAHQSAIRLLEGTMRLLHSHRTIPLPANCYPKYRITNERAVEIDWAAYDALMQRWLDGSALPDRVPIERWLVPISLDYPAPPRGVGLESPRVARLMAAYLAECKRHFEQRGWGDRAIVQLEPPGELTAERVERVRRATAILAQSEARFPLVAHLPVRTLRGLGWQAAPTIELADAPIWAPPADWFEPEAMLRARGGGQETWFVPSSPPYSGSLAIEAPPTDARQLAWQAARHGAQAIWIQHAAAIGLPRGASPSDAGLQRSDDCLVYPGVEFGIVESPIASARLKRLRRGIQDAEMLRLLDERGGARLAQRATEQLVRWAFTDAAGANLLATHATGWSQDPYAYWLARELLLSELSSDDKLARGESEETVRLLADWGRLMSQNDRVSVEIDGVRLESGDSQLRGSVRMTVSNATPRALTGRVSLPVLPSGWAQKADVPVAVQPGGRAMPVVELSLASLTYNTGGVYPFAVVLRTDELGDVEAQGRLAIAACPTVERAPIVDGELGEWEATTSNTLGDFKLVRGSGGAGDRSPTCATQSFFCTDEQRLYVAVVCALPVEERPSWQSNNVVPIDGSVPWGQDVVEILLSPRNVQAGSGGDMFVLQIKPSGVAIGRKGCLTDPPMNASTPWQHGAEVSVTTRGGAWIVEAAIPLSALDASALSSRIWGANVTRLDAKRGEYSSWSGARGTCYLPERLGNLIFARP